MRFLMLLSVYICFYAPVLADLAINEGEFTVIDFGNFNLIKKVTLSSPEIARVYQLSGSAKLDKHSVLVLQGLKTFGETDLLAYSELKIHSFHLEAGSTSKSKVKVIDPLNTKFIKRGTIKAAPGRLILVNSRYPVNEYVLAAKAELVTYKKLLEPSDPNYLKTFGLATADFEGLTELIIATSGGVFMYELDIKNAYKGEHQSELEIY
jgi:hypothetical protein